MRKVFTSLAALAVGIGSFLAATPPAGAITGGTEDLGEHVLERRDGRLLPTRRALPVLGHADRPAGGAHRRALHVPGHRQGHRHLRSR